MLIAMAGLPGTGKSTIARRLADVIGGVVLSKDIVHSALFPPSVLNYSAEEDDIAFHAIFRAAGYIARSFPQVPVILDGRTFSRSCQIRDLIEAAAAIGTPVRIIECICSDEVAELRLARDHSAANHPAGNRTPELYHQVKARAEPVSVPRLTLDTSDVALDQCVRRAVEYLSHPLPHSRGVE